MASWTNNRLRIAAAAVLALFVAGLTFEFFGLLDDSAATSPASSTRSEIFRGNTAPTAAPGTTKTKLARQRYLEPVASVNPGSKGIVLCLHDRIIPLGVSLITELRCLGNHDHIQIYHCMGELSAQNQQLIKDVDANVEIIDICEQLLGRNVIDRNTIRSFRSFWLKPLALHQTSLDHVLMIDADAILLKDPALLRDTEGYKTTGTVFFHDRVINDSMYFNREVDVADSPGKKEPYLHHFLKTFDYARLDIPDGYSPSSHLLSSFAYSGRSAHEMDSSMVLVRKSTAKAALAIRVLWILITETRFEYEFSYGDKEAFWLSYELAHAPYFFSPWGASVLSSETNRDMATHATTLCGSLAHYMPVLEAEPELLYVNGKAVVDPVPFNVNDLKNLRANLLFNMLPTHMSPRRKRTPPVGEKDEKGNRRFFSECLVGLGATPTPPQLLGALWRRRLHFMAVSMGRLGALRTCD